MCILLWTTACADQGFSLILLSNRDEFLRRPTQVAGPWTSTCKTIYGGRDLARIENGTWLGLTRGGRFAALTNIRETNSTAAIGPESRGAVVSSFLNSSSIERDDWMDGFEKDGLPQPFFPDLSQVGGFSMLCGRFVRSQESKVRVGGFGIMSNKGDAEQGHMRKLDALDPTDCASHGLSNSTFVKPWPKVCNGQLLLNQLVHDIQQYNLSDQDIYTRAFNILSDDTLSAKIGWEATQNKIGLLKESIFIPLFQAGQQSQPTEPQPAGKFSIHGQAHSSHVSSYYGTQKQTVIIVHDTGEVRYVERTLFDWLQGKIPAGDHIVNMSFDLDV